MTIQRGILLAGGSGSRLDPMTRVASKQLLPIYDKPMVYYPLSTLMMAGLREILLITTVEDAPRFEQLLGDGSQWGIDLRIAIQENPDGIAAALLVAESFIANEPVCLLLGDNLFYGKLGLDRALAEFEKGARAFAFPVTDPERYAVVEFAADGSVQSLEEKPQAPRGNYAVAGLYLLDGTAVARTKTLKPSARGELEITDLNRSYLDDGDLAIEPVGRGVSWLDTGTPESMLEASQMIATVQRRQGLRIGCPEEVSWRAGWIDDGQFRTCLESLPPSPYRDDLAALLSE